LRGLSFDFSFFECGHVGRVYSVIDDWTLEWSEKDMLWKIPGTFNEIEVYTATDAIMSHKITETINSS
jgi:hypothetical protein